MGCKVQAKTPSANTTDWNQIWKKGHRGEDEADLRGEVKRCFMCRCEGFIHHKGYQKYRTNLRRCKNQVIVNFCDNSLSSPAALCFEGKRRDFSAIHPCRHMFSVTHDNRSAATSSTCVRGCGQRDLTAGANVACARAGFYLPLASFTHANVLLRSENKSLMFDRDQIHLHVFLSQITPFPPLVLFRD